MYLTGKQWKVLLAIVTIQAEDGPGDDGLLEANPKKGRDKPLLTRKEWDEDYTQRNLDEIRDEIKSQMPQ